jgi:hypothetical protein
MILKRIQIHLLFSSLLPPEGTHVLHTHNLDHTHYRKTFATKLLDLQVQ